MPIVELTIDSKGALTGAKTYDQATDKIVKSTTKAEGALTRLKGGFGKIASAAGPAIAGLTAAMVGVGAKGIQLASDLEETQNKFDVVFKGMEETAEGWAENLAANYLMTTEEAKRFLSSTQDLLKPMGIAAQQAGAMSNQVAMLAADLGSFNNLPTGQVMADIQSALVGNYETMKKYGVVLNATTIEANAYATGITKMGEEVDAAAKAQSALDLVMKGSADAIGDISRSSGSYANQMKQLKTNLTEIATAIGTVLMPYALAFVEAVVDWTSKQENLNLVIDSTKLIIDGLKGALLIVKLAIDGVYTAFSKMIQIITGGLAKMLKPFTKFNKSIKAAYEGLKSASDNAKHFSEAAQEGFGKSLESLQNLKGGTDELTGGMGQLTAAGGEANDMLDELLNNIEPGAGKMQEMAGSTNAAAAANDRLYQSMQLVNGEWTNQAGSVSSLSNALGIVIPQVEGLSQAQIDSLNMTQQATQATQAQGQTNQQVAQTYQQLGESARQASQEMQQTCDAQAKVNSGNCSGGGKASGGGGTYKSWTELPAYFTDEMAKEYARFATNFAITDDTFRGRYYAPGIGPSASQRESHYAAQKQYNQNQLDPDKWFMRNYSTMFEAGGRITTESGITVNFNQEMSKDQIEALLAELERAQSRQ